MIGRARREEEVTATRKRPTVVLGRSKSSIVT